MYRFYILLPFFFIIACNNNTKVELKKCQSSVQKEVEKSPYFTELIAFKEYLIEHQLLLENEKNSYHNLLLRIIQNPTSSDGILSSYQYNYQYSLNVKTECLYNPVSYAALHQQHSTAYYKSKDLLAEENSLQFKELTESFHNKLDKNFLQSNLFGYLTIHQLYSTSLKLKIKALNIINLNITVDNLLIEDQASAMETLKEDLVVVIQRKKEVLKSLDLDDNLSLNMNVNSMVKMGRVSDIKRVIQSLDYDRITIQQTF